jgi:hypothetical protein
MGGGSKYDEFMKLAKEEAKEGDLSMSLKYLKFAKNLDNNEKVRKRIKKIQEALDESMNSDYEPEENDSETSVASLAPDIQVK